MNERLARFNAFSAEEAERLLYSCFANDSWAGRVARGRPYATVNALLTSAESSWTALEPSDWLDAFAAHPRVGERGGHSPDASEREQSAIREGTEQTLAALAAQNRQYEARFGHVFLIAASGRTAQEVLEAMRQRMANDPKTELEVAAGEHRKITRLRLQELVKR